MKNLVLFFSVFTVLVFSGCSSELEPIDYGKDDCHWCQMRIMDPKFGAEAVTQKGRTYKFDSAECLLHYLGDQETQHSHLAVTNFESAETFINAEEAWFLVSDKMPSPMGGFLNAFENSEIADSYREKNGGETYNWEQIKAKYNK